MSSTDARTRRCRWRALVAAAALVLAPGLTVPAQAATATVSGVVKSVSQSQPTPTALEGATVRLMDPHADSSESEVVASVQSGADGRYTFANVPQGARYYVSVRKTPTYITERTPEFTLRGDVVKNVTLARSGTVTGRIIGTGGKPVARAYVQVLNGATIVQSGWSSSLGTFSLTQFKGGSYQVLVSFDAGPYQNHLVRLGSSTRIAVSDTGVTAVGDVRLRAGARMTGRVVNAKGKAVRKMRVHVLRVGSGPVNKTVRTAQTDASGRWTVSGLNSGAYRVQIMGSSRYVGRYVPVKGGQKAAKIPVGDRGTVTVRKVRVYRSAEARVTVRDTKGKRLVARVYAREVRGNKVYSKSVGWTYSGDRGVYDIGGLRAGRTYKIVVAAEPGRWKSVSSRRFTARADKITVVKVPRVKRL